MTGRSYKIDGERYPSVTTIISQTLPNPGITAWKLRVGEAEAQRISREATDWGTGIHALVEAVNRGNRSNLSPEQAAIVAPYVLWHDEHIETMIGAEKLLVSRQHGYAGTTDAIAVLAGDRYPSIIDFKSSKTALGQDEWRLQLAAYAIAAEEHLGLVCRRRIIVRLSRVEPNTLHVHELPEDELAEDKQCFLALLRIWKWHRAAGEIHTPVQDVLGQFIEDRCVIDAQAFANSGVLYKVYGSWCEETGSKAVTTQAFGRRLTERGMEAARGRDGKRIWRGLRLRGTDE